MRTTGFPDPSTWASAARNSAVITCVEYLRNSGAYWRQVSAGDLVQRAADGEEQLGRLADYLIYPVQNEPEQNYRGEGDQCLQAEGRAAEHLENAAA